MVDQLKWKVKLIKTNNRIDESSGRLFKMDITLDSLRHEVRIFFKNHIISVYGLKI